MDSRDCLGGFDVVFVVVVVVGPSWPHYGSASWGKGWCFVTVLLSHLGCEGRSSGG